jgi:hypothetical protein
VPCAVRLPSSGSSVWLASPPQLARSRAPVTCSPSSLERSCAWPGRGHHVCTPPA